MHVLGAYSSHKQHFVARFWYGKGEAEERATLLVGDTLTLRWRAWTEGGNAAHFVSSVVLRNVRSSIVCRYADTLRSRRVSRRLQPTNIFKAKIHNRYYSTGTSLLEIKEKAQREKRCARIECACASGAFNRAVNFFSCDVGINLKVFSSGLQRKHRTNFSPKLAPETKLRVKAHTKFFFGKSFPNFYLRMRYTFAVDSID